MASYNLGTASGRIVIDGSAAQAGFQVASTAARAFYDAVEERVQAVDRLGTKLIAVGTAGVGGFGVAVKTASAFEAQLDAVEAVSGATATQMDAIREKALQLGKDTAYSASESAAAFEILIKAGVSVDDVINGAAEATVNLAAASGVDMTQAAEVAANALNVFNLEGKDMAGVADLIAGASNASAIDVTDFAYSLSSGGAVAHLAGLDFKDLAVAIAEMGQAGIKGSDAGTSLKTFLTNLIPTTKAQINEFQRLGLMTADYAAATQFLAQKGIKPLDNSILGVSEAFQKYIEVTGGAKVGTAANRDAAEKLAIAQGGLNNEFFDAKGEVKDLAAIQQVLQDATKGMTKEQKLASLELLFGSDAIRAAAVLSEEGAAGYNKMAEAMGKVTAADVAKTRLSNLSGAVEQLKGALETVRITIGSYFLPILTKMTNGLTAVVNVFNNAPKWVQTTIVAFLGLFTAGSLLTGILIKLSFVLVPLLGKFLGFRILKQTTGIFLAFFKVLRGGGGIAAAFTAASVAAGKLGKTFGTIFTWGKRLFTLIRGSAALWALFTGPIGWAVLAIIALVAIIAVLYNKFEGVRKVVDTVGRAIRDGFLIYIQWVKQNIQDLINGFNGVEGSGSRMGGLFTKIGQAVRFVWEALKAFWNILVTNVWPAIKEGASIIWAALGPALEQVRDAFMNKLLPALREAWNSIKSSLVPAFKQVWEAMKQVGAAFAEVWPKIQPVVKAVGTVLVVALGLLFYALFKVGMFIITQVIPWLMKFGATIVGFLIGAFGKWVSFVVGSVLPPLVTFFGWIISTAVPILMTITSFIWGVLIGAFKAIATWVMFAYNTWKTVFSAIIGFVSPILSAIGSFIMSWLNTIWSFWKTIWDLFTSYLRVVVAFWTLIIRAVLYALKVVFDTVLKPIWDWFVAGWKWVGDQLKSAWDTMYNVVRTVFELVRNWIVTKIAEIKVQWAAFTATLRQVWDTVWNAVKTIVQNVINFIKGSIQTWVNWFKGLWNTLTNLIPTPVKNGFNSALNAIKSWTTTAINFVKTIPGKITGALGNLGSLLYNAGKSVIQGFINGIKSMLSTVENTLKSLTDKIPKVKGPEDVDRKLLVKNGQLIMQGLRNGINQGAKGVLSDLSALTGAIAANGTVNMGAMTSVGLGPVRTRGGDGATATGGPLFGPGAIQVNAPQNMSAAQVGQQVASKTAYKLATATTSPRIPGVTDR